MELKDETANSMIKNLDSNERLKYASSEAYLVLRRLKLKKLDENSQADINWAIELLEKVLKEATK